jgi:NAD(P)-dependent dehydrogenase (short-subunit alcohol dehydrogenase family)
LQDEAREASLSVQVASLDVTDSLSCEAFVAAQVDRFGRIDALVNNAGYGLWGPWEHLSDKEVQAVFETNFIGAMRLSRLVLPGMRKQRFGTIINIGSISGQVGSPGAGAYAATKFAMNAMSRSMRLEVGRFGVRVVLLEPGYFQSDFTDSQVMAKGVDLKLTPYQAMRNTKPAPINEFIRPANPLRVARRVRQVIESRWPRARYTVGHDAWLGSKAIRYLPDWLVDLALCKAQGW